MAIDTGVLDAFKAAIDQQTQMAVATGGKVLALSASIRPVVTYWILLLWSLMHLWLAYNAYQQALPAMEVFRAMLSPDFAALVSGTLNYWFLDRTLQKRGLQ